MLNKLDYYQLVIEGFKSLRRDIKEAEEYTVNEHNALLAQMQKEQAAQEAKTSQTAQPAQQATTTAKTTKTSK